VRRIWDITDYQTYRRIAGHPASVRDRNQGASYGRSSEPYRRHEIRALADPPTGSHDDHPARFAGRAENGKLIKPCLYAGVHFSGGDLINDQRCATGARTMRAGWQYAWSERRSFFSCQRRSELLAAWMFGTGLRVASQGKCDGYPPVSPCSLSHPAPHQLVLQITSLLAGVSGLALSTPSPEGAESPPWHKALQPVSQEQSTFRVSGSSG
jgi:hypothetical protein